MVSGEPAGLTRRRLYVVTGATVLVGTVGCDSPKRRAADRPVDNVTYLTGFGMSGRESYALVARDKGFFAEAGLEVTIVPGAAGDANHQALAAGKAQFAAVDASGVIVRYARGEDTSFQVVAAVQQRTLLSIVALQGSGIIGPKDLEGRTIGVATGAAPKTLFPAYARLAGIDETKVRWENSSPPQLPTLLTVSPAVLDEDGGSVQRR